MKGGKQLKQTGAILSAVLFIIIISSNVYAGENKNAIVLASFGTSYPKALNAIVNIGQAVKKAFPDYEIRHAFTSNIIRKIWHKRQLDETFLLKHGDTARDFIHIKTPLATIAGLQNEGYRTIYVQPLHIYAGESFYDLSSYIDGLKSIKTLQKQWMPFETLALGRPLLGKPGPEHLYRDDVEKCAKALAQDVCLAKKENAALVYMGHGNKHFSTGVYVELQNMMRDLYPETKIYIGNVEGYPSYEDVADQLREDGVEKILLKPFMVVAGDHAANDMAGDDDSWKHGFLQLGIEVDTCLQGLGEIDALADIYAAHVKDLIKP